VDVKFLVKKKALDKYEDLEDPSKRERLQMAWGKSHEPDDEFHFARDGDHCMVLFECDLCIFRKLKKRSPDFTNPGDDLDRLHPANKFGCILELVKIHSPW
jgi:hypothetical protein